MWAVSQVIMFEEQEADYKVHFEDVPDLGMAVDIQWLKPRTATGGPGWIWIQPVNVRFAVT